MVERWRQRVERASERVWLAVLAAAVGLLAAIPRLVGLLGGTPGFQVEEATNALMARQISRDQLPIFFGHEDDAVAPFFPYLVRATSELTGWGPEGPRLAAALCGIGAAIFGALWLSRALGRPWGLAGGVLIAFGFWPLMYSNQALPPISGAVFAALGPWLAWEGLQRAITVRGPVARSRRFKPDYPWFIAAGVAFGLGFYTATGYLVIPGIVMILAATLSRRQQMARPDLSVAGPGIMVLVMALVMMPLASFYLENPDDFRRYLDLAGGLPESIAETRGPYRETLESLVWQGTDNPAHNLPGRPLIDPILVVWGGIGLLVALRHPLRPLHSVALSALILGPLASGVLTSNDPGLLIPLAPMLFALPVIGMQGVYGLIQRWGSREMEPAPVHHPPSSSVAGEGDSPSRPYGGARTFAGQGAVWAAAVLIGVSVVASSAWSLYDYFWQWAGSEEAYLAMRGDLRDAVEAVEDLPDDGLPVYLASGDAERVVRYLAPERPRRDIESPAILPMPEDEEAYLVYARSTAPHEPLLAYFDETDLLQTGEGPEGETAYWVWVLSPRLRDRLPHAAPAIPFENAWLLEGFEAQTAPELANGRIQIDVVLLWGVPVDADPHNAVARLRPTSDDAGPRTTSEQVTIETWKNNPLGLRELILAHLRIPFPDIEDLTADLQAGLRDRSGGRAVLPLTAVQDEIYAFLNTIGLVSSE